MRSARRTIAIAVAGISLLLLLIAAGGGAVCRFTSIDCGLNDPPGDEVFEGAVPETDDPMLLEGFGLETVASDLVLPTSFMFMPGGQILIAEKDGIVKLFEDGALRSTPFLDIRNQVNDFDLNGLLDIEIDPDFSENGLFYALYSFREPSQPEDGSTTVRISRFIVEDDVAQEESEEILLGADFQGTCDTKPDSADCIPVDTRGLAGGDIEFGTDGSMFISTGDGAHSGDPTAIRAQRIDSLAGKLLRVTRDGDGLPDNPFWNGDPEANQSKVWALGLRNPFRFTLESEGERVLIGDVGWFDWEEIDVGGRAANYGWPCYEGPDRSAEYESSRTCQELYDAGEAAVEFPVLAHSRETDGQSVTGGVIYTGDNYPAELHGRYVYGDWARGWVRFVRLDGVSEADEDDAVELISRAGGPVEFEVGPDGDLYYLALNASELRRIIYAPEG